MIWALDAETRRLNAPLRSSMLLEVNADIVVLPFAVGSPASPAFILTN